MDGLPRSLFRGALLGVAVGDALGAGFEGDLEVDPHSVQQLLREPGPLHFTDDTHMTLAMAESLVAQEAFEGSHMAATFVRNFEAEPWRGYGPGPPQVFRAIRRGARWDEAGRRLFGGSGSYGNGAAMRVCPAAMFACRDLDRVAWLARQTALITHTHELGIEGAVLQASAIAMLLTTRARENLDRHAFLRELRRRARTDIFRRALDRVESLAPDSGPDVVAAELGNGIEAYRSVPTALYLFLSRASSFTGAVFDAICLGGDTDTIASMTGALSGAWLGESALPEVWRTSVEGAKRLEDLADGLWHLAVGSGATS